MGQFCTALKRGELWEAVVGETKYALRNSAMEVDPSMRSVSEDGEGWSVVAKNDHMEVGVSAGGGQIAVWVRPTGGDRSLVEEIKDEVLEPFLVNKEKDLD